MFETQQIVELIVVLVTSIIVLVASYSAPIKISIGILLLMIPFQPVETIYGSANVVMTFIVIGALMLRGRLRYAPMLGALLAVFFAYLITLSQLPRSLHATHGLQVVFLFSGLLVFVLAYNLAREVENPRYVINVFIISNVLAVIYCLIQFGVGPGERLYLFGMPEFALHRNRGGGDPRLVGPFGSPTITSGYFMSMIVILAYEILHSAHRRRVALSILAVLNVGMLMGTANRGSFLVLIASLLAFLYLFRNKLGMARIAQMLVASTVVIAAVGVTLATYTDFGQMLSRLDRTAEFEGGVPDTRQRVWPEAVAAIPDRLWTGHGPRLVAPNELRRRSEVPPEQLVQDYPHNLYLYLLLTVGVIGTACMLFLLLGATWRVYRGAQLGNFANDYERGLVVLGLLVLGGFFVDEIKIEFLRRSSIDYVHFVFAMFGAFLAFADRGRARARVAQSEVKSAPFSPRLVPAAPRVATRKRA